MGRWADGASYDDAAVGQVVLSGISDDDVAKFLAKVRQNSYGLYSYDDVAKFLAKVRQQSPAPPILGNNPHGRMTTLYITIILRDTVGHITAAISPINHTTHNPHAMAPIRNSANRP